MAADINPMLKQNFLGIGAQKAGTTTLADILSRHSDIFIPAIKETKFFLFEEDYNKGIDFYNSTYFGDYNGQKAVGEFDPDYMLFPFVAKRISDTLGQQVKFIVSLRNPADRAYSHYLMSVKKGVETLPFAEALQEEQNRKTDIKQQKIFAYLERGYYGKQLSVYLDVFPKENFLFLVFEEDIVRNLDSTIDKLEDFLQVTHVKLDTRTHSNEAAEAKNEVLRDMVRKPNFAKRILKTFLPSAGVRKRMRRYFIRKNLKPLEAPKLGDTTRRTVIQKYFSEDITLTERLINRNLDIWRD